MKNAQADTILDLLRKNKGQWVSLSDIMDLRANGCRISKYTNRIFELRQAGYDIHNMTSHDDGIRKSWYKLVSEPSYEIKKEYKFQESLF